ncbi:site-2 protease family protein [Longirhabdus pacifica]|uniref:site-2 protease family protein n=1 Tax=Longirhabdus pacifica TaxID=2305227 RepID=UPI0010091613|nr:site-2 protease family protein [Longirhabdus pacifica]
MDRIFAYNFEQLPFVLLVLLIAFAVHECSHAYFAYKFGDDTAYKQGRVTLNPRAHLDVLGTLLILLVGFGWAKPVPVNRNAFKKPRLMSVIVSIAGPLSNLLLAFLFFILWYVVLVNQWLTLLPGRWPGAVEEFLTIGYKLNTVLFLFNLIPLPPLDGYRIAHDLAPRSTRAKMTQNEHWGTLIFLLIVFIPFLRSITIAPLFNLADYINMMMFEIIRFVL